MAHRGSPEDHRARFLLRPNLEDYLALKAKLGRAFAEERPRLLRQVQDPALLARILLLEEDWKALDRLLQRAPPEAYPALAEALEAGLPQEAVRLYLEAAAREVEKHPQGLPGGGEAPRESLPPGPQGGQGLGPKPPRGLPPPPGPKGSPGPPSRRAHERGPGALS